MHLGGSLEKFDVKPDLICFSKALGNGHPISGCVGSDKVKDAASQVFFTGSFFTSSVPTCRSWRAGPLPSPRSTWMSPTVSGMNVAEWKATIMKIGRDASGPNAVRMIGIPRRTVLENDADMPKIAWSERGRPKRLRPTPMPAP